MKPTIISKSCALPDGRQITIETGKLARQADGSVVLRMGNTMLLATAVAAPDAKEGTDFLPLSVDYQEKFAAMGKIPGGFLKREGKLSDYEVLISRLVDRAIRPLFPDDYHAETQVNIQLISGDYNALPDSLAAFAASAALAVSDIPFQGPISEVRVVRADGKFIINPTLEEKEKADLDFIVAASIDNILMVEGESKEISEMDMLEALKLAHEVIKTQCQVQIELSQAVGKTEKRTYEHEVKDENFKAELFKLPNARRIRSSGAISTEPDDPFTRNLVILPETPRWSTSNPVNCPMLTPVSFATPSEMAEKDSVELHLKVDLPNRDLPQKASFGGLSM